MNHCNFPSKIAIQRMALCILFAAFAFKGFAQDSFQYHTDRLTLIISNPAAQAIDGTSNLSSDSTLNEILQSYQVMYFKKMHPNHPNSFLAKKHGLVIQSGNLDSLITELSNTGLIDGIHKRIVDVPLSYPCSTPVIVDDAKWPIEMVNAECAWEIAKGSSSVIAFSDAGFQVDHEDLASKYAFVDAHPNPLCRGGGSHGTSVASVACAIPDNGVGIAGVAFDAKIYACWSTPGTCLDPYYYVDAAAIRAIDNGARILNNSNSGIFVFQEEWEYVASRATIVLAGGNSAGERLYSFHYHTPPGQYPEFYTDVAEMPGVILVTSHNEDKKLFDPISNKTHSVHRKIDICAPGFHVLTATVYDPNNPSAEKYTEIDNGTSIAAPFVAGVAALMYDANPCLTPAEVEDIIKSTAIDDIVDPIYDGEHNAYGTGRLDAYGAVLGAKAAAILTDITISSSQSWTTDTEVKQDVVIESGATLTISAKVMFCPTKGIIVKPGGKLVLANGGHLTSYWRWKGVWVWGNANQPQTDAYQGVVVLQDGSIIENAGDGIMLWKSGDWGSTGGIVRATGATFKNNRRAVGFMSYKYQENVSWFRDCHFIRDKDEIFYTLFNTDYHIPTGGVPGGNRFHAFITMWEVTGVRIHGCTFENTVGTNGIGILAMDSKFEVGALSMGIPVMPTSSLCEFGCTKTVFKGLGEGIRAMDAVSTNSFRVSNSTFENCLDGVVSEAINAPFIFRNLFDLGPRGLGIYINRGNAYQVEANKFMRSNVDLFSNYGILVNSTGPNNNVIYRNTFEDVFRALMSQGSNRNGKEGTTGLRFVCNDIGGNTENGILAYGLKEGEGMAKDQWGGKQPFNPALSAGNLFAQLYPLGDFYNASGYPVHYYFDFGNLLEEPVGRAKVNVFMGQTNSCSPKITVSPGSSVPGGMDPVVRGNTITMYRGAMDAVETRLDDGDLIGSVVIVQNTSNASDLYDYLMDVAPWVSQTVLQVASDRGLLDQARLLEVMLANPDATQSEFLLHYLEHEAPVRLDPHEIDSIRGSWGTVTERTEFEWEYADAAAEMALVNNLWLLYYMSDTTADQTDSVHWILQTTPLLSYKYQLVESLLYHGNVAVAMEQLDSIPYNFALSPYEQKEHEWFVQLSELQKDWVTEERNLFMLHEHEILALQEMADSSRWLAGQRARNIIQIARDTLFELTIDSIPFGGGGGGFFIMVPASAAVPAKQAAPQPKIAIYPNPANNVLHINYTGTSGEMKNGRLNLYSMDGRLASTQTLQPVSTQTVGLEKLPSGVYMLEIRLGNETVREKLILKR